MSIQTQPGEFRLIPVSQLVLSTLNVRKSGGDAGIGELAALIQSQGVLQNLTVVEDDVTPSSVAQGTRVLPAL